MNPASIPATVAVLTFNSDKTLRRALESAKQFEDIVICDGGSADKTLDIAREFGARVVAQDKRFLDAEGRISDYGGVRNQTLDAAARQWFFSLDSDEYLSAELVEEIRGIVERNAPAAYWVPRKYAYKGSVIDNATTYPSRQMRFFHRASARRFIKEVHEKIELLPEVSAQELAQAMLVPLPDTAGEMISKWRRYLSIERARRGPVSLRRWLLVALHEAGVAALYLCRLGRILLLSKGSRLPVSFETARLWYQWRLIADSARNIRTL